MSRFPPRPAVRRANAGGVQYIQAMRLFKDEPKWTPLNRSDELESNEHRKAYVSQYSS